MKSISSLDGSGIRGVFTDIDDTLTTDGQLPEIAYHALWSLREAGLLVIPVTGRPAGWCDHIARMWPVDGVVGENGAFYFYYDRARGRLAQRFWHDAQTQRACREKLSALGEQIIGKFEGVALASDQNYRACDLAVDYTEDVAAVATSVLDDVVDELLSAGASVRVSSIHVNAWFGDYDKRKMTVCLMRELFGVELDQHQHDYVFVGDSPNDEPMFEYFTNSVGVANIHRFTTKLRAPPTYVTDACGGAGFAELVRQLISRDR